MQTVIEPLKELYDVIIIDTTPSLGILTVNAITASDGVLITVTPQLLSAIGLKLLIKTIQKVQKHINPDVVIEGALTHQMWRPMVGKHGGVYPRQ